MHKILPRITFCVILVCFLTACQDAREIDDMTYVVAIGIDKGVSDKLRYTFEYPTLAGGSGGQEQSSGGGKSEGGKGYKTVSVDEHAFFEAFDVINSLSTRDINLMHLKAIVISEDLARSGELADYITPIIRFREIRRETNIAIVKGTAMDFLSSIKPDVGTSLFKSFENLFNTVRTTGFTPDVRLLNFYNDIKSSYGSSIATLGAVNDEDKFKENGQNFEKGDVPESRIAAGEVIEQGGNNVGFFGTALFDGDKMVGELDGKETRYMLLTRGDFKRAVFIIKDPLKPGHFVAVNLGYDNPNKLKVRFENGAPVIELKVYLEGEIRATQSLIDYEKEALKPTLERACENEIKEGIDKLIEKCKGLKTDIFGFGEKAQVQFFTIEEWEKYNWLGNFDKVRVNTKVHVDIRRSGNLVKNSSIKSSEGEHK